MPKVLRKPVFSPKSGKKREKGVAKPAVSFRSPEDVIEWLKSLEAKGHDRTDVIVTALRVGRDVSARIGDKWYEVEYRAKREGVEPGEMLAQLALVAIAAENATPPKPSKK